MSNWHARLIELSRKGFNPELVRFAINEFKRLGSEEIKIPPYPQPADSFIHKTVLEILNKAEEIGIFNESK